MFIINRLRQNDDPVVGVMFDNPFPELLKVRVQIAEIAAPLTNDDGVLWNAAARNKILCIPSFAHLDAVCFKKKLPFLS